VLRLAWYTADSIQRFDSKTNWTADSIRTKKTIHRSLVYSAQWNKIHQRINDSTGLLLVTSIINYKLLCPVRPLQLDLDGWDTAYAVPVGSCMLELQPTSQPAGIGLLPMILPTDPLPELRSLQQKCRPTWTHFWKDVIIFVTMTSIDIKPSTCHAHGRHVSACKILPSYDALFRRR